MLKVALQYRFYTLFEWLLDYCTFTTEVYFRAGKAGGENATRWESIKQNIPCRTSSGRGCFVKYKF
ncbi:hypothetical protein [uncultured Pontibacter sp.]|uniref:hypothetical protein n=1 Tax=uncultured Pontibacter sp. TaxID=453356 RepID=UPI00262D2832|nr:hypothetical protein [uncultured Pontibacter sp.]